MQADIPTPTPLKISNLDMSREKSWDPELI